MEVWKNIEETNGIYQVSNKGRIKRVGIYKNQFTSWHNEYILKPAIHERGYLFVQLSVNGKILRRYIHRLVAQAFIPNVDKKATVNHKNGDKTNNCVENLEWCNQSYNTKHAYKNNLIKHYKIEINQSDLEGNDIKTWESAKEIEKKLKIKNSQICRCCKNENLTAGGYHWKYYKIK